MRHVHLRFYAELNDHLPPARRQVGFDHAFWGSPTAAEVIAACGVPLGLVDLVLANGHSVDLAYRIHEGDRISVYPVFEAMDIAPLVRVRLRPLRETRFVAGDGLEALAVRLRLLGFDTVCGDWDPASQRILLAGTPEVLHGSDVTHAVVLHASTTRGRVRELVRRLHLESAIAPRSRCARCNGLLEGSEPPALRSCPRCKRAFRWNPLQGRLRALFTAEAEAPPDAARP